MQNSFPDRCLYVLSILLMSTICVYPKTPSPKNKIVYARQLTVENGLSSNFVYTLLRDSKNFTWIGTVNGLNKYDGHTFRYYFHKPFDSTGIQSNRIKALAEDKSGAIWIGTVDAGLEKLDRNTDKFIHFRHNSSDPNSLGSDNVTSLFVDSKGRLWVGLGNGELDYFEPQAQKFWRYTNVASINFSIPINVIMSISEDSHGILYIRKTRGTVVFDPLTAECKELSVLDQSGRKYIESATVIRVPVYDGGLFSANEHTIYSFKLLTSQLNIAKAKKINSIFPITFDGKCLIYQSDSLLWNFSIYGLQEIDISSSTIFNVEVRSLKNTILKFRSTRDGFSAKDGTVWIASENGIIIVEPDVQPIGIYPLPDKNNTYYSSARSLCLDNHERLWVGTSMGHLYYLDTLRAMLHEFSIHNFTNGGAFNRMSFDSNNFLWIVGTSHPLLRVNIKNNLLIDFGKDKNFSLASTAHSLLIDGSFLWTGSKEEEKLPVEGVLNFLTFSPLSAKHYEYLPYETGMTSNRIVMAIVKKDQNSLWLGTAHGLFLFDIKSSEFTRYAHDPKDPNSLSGDNVWAIHKDRRGKWWIGTYGEGLNLFDERNQGFTHYTIEDGLSSNSIRSILEDISGNLWISTDHGISCFDQIAKTFTNYGISDGLLDLDYEPNSAAVSIDGKMYFGGAKGVVSFFPEALKRKYIAAPLFVTAFRISNYLRFGEIMTGSVMHLDYTENDFSFEFAKLDYLDPSQKQYEYMLEGFDPEWIHSGAVNIARYNNIEPGDYTFKFRLKDDTSHVFASFVIINPPLWLTWWFKLGIFLVILLLSWYLYRRRLAKLKEFYVQLELAAEHERIELAGELHDGPLQDLYATRFLLDPLIRSEGSPLDAAKLEGILRKVRGDLRTLTGELQIPHFELGLAEELRLFCDSFSERHTMIHIVQDIRNEISPLPLKSAQNLFRIFRTAMANVAEHANASKIDVSFVTTQEDATLKIVDDGIGFTVPDDIGKLSRNEHYGLFLMQNYAEIINGKCLVSSSLGSGTAIAVIIPLKLPLWRKKRIV